MFHLTHQEKVVLLSVSFILWAGCCFDFLCKTFPQWSRSIHMMETSDLAVKINLNEATEEDLLRLPYIGPSIAQKIIAHRKAHGRFYSLDELKTIEGIRTKNYQKFSAYLYVK